MDRVKAHLSQQLEMTPKAQKNKMIRKTMPKRMNTVKRMMMNGEMMKMITVKILTR